MKLNKFVTSLLAWGGTSLALGMGSPSGQNPTISSSTLQILDTFEKKQIDMCFGYRGNGTSVFATFGGIARFFDQYGGPGAIVGTSSGSVAAFLTESIMIPNEVYECESCGIDEANQRRSFVLKAFPLTMKAFTESPDLKEDIQTIRGGKQVFDTIMELAGGIGLGGQRREGATANPSASGLLQSEDIQAVLTSATLSLIKNKSKELKNFITPEFYKIAGVGGEGDPRLVKAAIDNLLVFQGVKSGDNFSRKDLMYPGVVNFGHIFQTLGVVADWYAGYGSMFPKKELSELLDTCARGSKGEWWNTLAARTYGGSNCGREYYRLFSRYFNLRHKNSETPKRVDEPIGHYIPAFVSTSAISGNDKVEEINYHADSGEFASINDIDLGRDNFKVLYFGPDSHKQVITNNKNMFQDVVTQNIVSMGEVSWLMAMKASGQEPATARSLTFHSGENQYLATGGYVDQLPTKLMKMIGCNINIAFNTNRPILGFANRYTPKIWNQDPDLVHDLFSSDDPDSAESLGFQETNALLCSRWESYDLKEIWEMADNSYHNLIFTMYRGLLSGYFGRKGGELRTKFGEPKSCYATSHERGHIFPPYR